MIIKFNTEKMTPAIAPLLNESKDQEDVEIVYDPPVLFSFEAKAPEVAIKHAVEVISDELTIYQCEKLKSWHDLVDIVEKHFPGVPASSLDVNFGIVSVTISLKKQV